MTRWMILQANYSSRSNASLPYCDIHSHVLAVLRYPLDLVNLFSTVSEQVKTSKHFNCNIIETNNLLEVFVQILNEPTSFGF